MTGDLFVPAGVFERLDIQGAEVSYLRRFEMGASFETLLGRLIAETPWRSEQIVVWGKTFPQPRLIAWYGDANTSYTYSGIQLAPLPWTDLLSNLKGRVEAVAHAKFNSVLLNYYRDHRDSMGFHSDDEPELGLQPTIASISLGEARTFVLKHKTRSDLRSVRLQLESGSLLLMRGDTQRNWKHGIGKLSRPCGPRVNLTFRLIHAPSDSALR